MALHLKVTVKVVAKEFVRWIHSRDVQLKLGCHKLLKLQRVRTEAIEPATDSMS